MAHSFTKKKHTRAPDCLLGCSCSFLHVLSPLFASSRFPPSCWWWEIWPRRGAIWFVFEWEWKARNISMIVQFGTSLAGETPTIIDQLPSSPTYPKVWWEGCQAALKDLLLLAFLVKHVPYMGRIGVSHFICFKTWYQFLIRRQNGWFTKLK